MDPPMRDRVTKASESGKVLRYVAEVNEAGGSVGMVDLPPSSPLANLKYIGFRTGHYDSEPLLIAGKGAGLDMTAAGVLGDMIGLGREQLFPHI